MLLQYGVGPSLVFDNVGGYVEVFKFFNAPFVYGATNTYGDYDKWVDNPSLCFDFIDRRIIFISCC